MYLCASIKTAINAMYERIGKTILHNDNLDSRLALLHSDTQTYYLTNKDDNTDIDNVLTYVTASKQLSLQLPFQRWIRYLILY